jgi:Flp pilus assembly protein TadG
MTDARASTAQILRRATLVGRALRNDARATAAVEAALILPVALTMFALLIYGAEAFAIQRKVTLTARTVTDLVTQAAPTQMSSGASLVSHSQSGDNPGIDTYLGVSSSVLTPYASANLSMLISEVQVNSDQVTAVVQWSEPCPSSACPNNGLTARPLGQTITLPTGLGTGQAGSYFVLGEVAYNYTPLQIFTPATALTLHDAIYLTPRQSTSISCTDCTTHS